MKFKTFALSFADLKKGAPFHWQKGTLQIPETVTSPLLRDMLKKFPWQAELVIDSSFKGNTPEDYALNITAKEICLSASTPQGLLFGAATLLRFSEVEDLFECRFTASPKAKQRGLKLYLPPPDEEAIKEFYAIIDLAVRYKYNFIMLELGGAMEYQSHPEINDAYIRYAAFMNEYPGKAMKIQNSFKWRKNSIHTDNGGGQVLSQALLKEIAAFCRERHLEIIPEVPCLSHCDYLLAAYPHLAERPEDPYPDTACPSKEEYYTILSDLLQEVISVFAPQRINIGHDEYYTIGLCPECRQKTAPQIYADDINRTAAFLKEHQVKTIIWGEKLLNSHFLSGRPCGGAEIPDYTEPELEGVPATYPAMELISKDVEIFHWYWSIDRDLDKEYDTRERKYLFGNFGSIELPDWKKRSDAANFQGICVSNWGRTDYETMRRNGILFDLIASTYLCWNKNLGSEDYAVIFNAVSDELQQLNKNRFPAGAELFTITHTVDTQREFLYFFDGNFINEKNFLLGHHVFLSEKGKAYRFPVIFGKNISNAQSSPGRICDPLSEFDRYIVNRQYIEILGGACPEKDKKGRTWYKAFYLHPAPGEKLTFSHFEAAEGENVSVEIKQ